MVMEEVAAVILTSYGICVWETAMPEYLNGMTVRQVSQIDEQ